MRLASVFLAFLLIFSSTTPTRTHDWYDADCCSNEDCRPVDCNDLVETKDGIKFGSFLFRKIRPSQDSKCHVCIYRGYMPMCVYVQQNS